jgi:hypothetical protein
MHALRQIRGGSSGTFQSGSPPGLGPNFTFASLANNDYFGLKFIGVGTA